VNMISKGILAGMLILSCAAGASAQTVWREGENVDRSTMNRHPWWYDQVKKELLSGGDWISNFSEEKEGTADYTLEIPKAGRYAFWIRANPVSARLDYALDRGGWTPIELTTGLIDTVNVAADGKPDLRFLAWKKVGELELASGRHAVRFRTYSGPQHHGAIDAFVFTTEPFLPKGTARPGQVVAGLEKGDVWPFLPERDTFRADALLDLRSLNERTAGEHGSIRLSPDKSGFVRGDGTPERFWAVTTYAQNDKSPGDLAHHARFLAKRGVNLVRLHGHLESHAKDPKLTDADPKAIDAAWRLVAAMKKEGIYTSISPYWSAELKHIPASWGIEGWAEGQSPFGLLFFNPKLQEGYKAWLKALLSPTNPYTGIPLAKDPALAMIHIQNEDSLLFWTEQNIKGKQLDLLGKQFGDWAKRKYGSLAAAGRAWGGEAMAEDDPSRGVLGIHIVWQFTQPRTGGLKKRLDDQLHFFAETMYRFNAEIARYLRQELGCQQLINAGNWKTADSIRLNDAERWSYTANEVLAVNTYYSPVHLGPDRGWRIDKGDQYEDVSVLLNPRAFPLDIKQVAGHPMMITETHWVPPIGYQSEAPFLAAAYQSMTGVDVLFWFSTGEVEWSNQDRAEWDASSRAKWAIATPMMLGQFPAAALLFRRGYVAQGPPVVVEHRSLEQIWGRVPPIIAEDPGYDPNRDLGDSARRSNLARGLDPLAFLVGPVQVVYGSDPSKTKAEELSRYIDRKNKVVNSDTGQLSWDYARGICVLRAPAAQGATGFLNRAGIIALGDVTIRSQNDYASVLVVALDGQPLIRSDRVLIQVGTRARPSGWSDHEATFTAEGGKETIHGRQIDSTGTMPWAIAAAKVRVQLRNPKLASAVPLDVNGNARGTIPVHRVGEMIDFELPKDALYVVLKAR
jgi:hypothetical protein